MTHSHHFVVLRPVFPAELFNDIVEIIFHFVILSIVLFSLFCLVSLPTSILLSLALPNIYELSLGAP